MNVPRESLSIMQIQIQKRTGSATNSMQERSLLDEVLLNVCQGMERRTRVVIESMEEGSLYIYGGQGA